MFAVNKYVASRLKEMGDAKRSAGTHQSLAYCKAAQAVENADFVITSGHEAKKLKGVGATMAKEIDKYLSEYRNTVANAQSNAPSSASVEQWLTAVGYPQYWPTFRDNGFDLPSAIKALDEESLLTMNVSKMGHRKALLKAAGEFNPAPPQAPPPSSSSAPAPPKPFLMPSTKVEIRRSVVVSNPGDKRVPGVGLIASDVLRWGGTNADFWRRGLELLVKGHVEDVQWTINNWKREAVASIRSSGVWDKNAPARRYKVVIRFESYSEIGVDYTCACDYMKKSTTGASHMCKHLLALVLYVYLNGRGLLVEQKKRVQQSPVMPSDNERSPARTPMSERLKKKKKKQPPAKRKQVDMADVVVVAAAGDASPSAPPPKKRAKKATKKAEYRPKFRSGGYAIMMALRNMHMRGGNKASTGMGKAELLRDAQQYTETSMAEPEAGAATPFYTGFSSMKTLVEKGYVDKPTKFKYVLTEAGLAVANDMFEKLELPSAPTRHTLPRPPPSSSSASQARFTSTGGLATHASHFKYDEHPTLGKVHRFDPQNEVALLYDHRERNGMGQLPTQLNGAGVAQHMLELRLGDFLWVLRSRSDPDGLCEVLHHVIERKSMDDLVQSLAQGRIDDQLHRLRGSPLDRTHLMISDEHVTAMGIHAGSNGHLSAAAKTNQDSATTDARTVVVRAMLEANCSTSQWKNSERAGRFLCHMGTLLKERYRRGELRATGVSFNEFNAPKKAVTHADLLASMLLLQPRVNEKLAYTISRKFGSLPEFIQVLRVKGERALVGQPLLRPDPETGEPVEDESGTKITKAMSVKMWKNFWGPESLDSEYGL